jgi:caffeoyl-CoA O-methyltransferase
MSTETTQLTEPLVEYLRSLFWEEDGALTGLTADLAVRGPQIQIGPDEGRLLQLLVAAVRAERVLEVGTLFGYSAIWMARALPPHGRLDTIEYTDAHADAARMWVDRAGLGDQVEIHRGAALEVLPRLSGPYDVAFFDAAKAEYPAYLDHALRLVRPGGLILADNVLWLGRVADRTVNDPDISGIREYNRRIATDPRLLSTIVPVCDGLAISVVGG